MLSCFIIDDEYPSLQELVYLLKGYREIKIAGLFQDPGEAFGEIEKQKPDLIFLDIDMPRMNGIDLALKIQSLQAGIMIVFVTAYEQYALDAYRVYPLDYILKPIDDGRFRQTMSHVLEQTSLRRLSRQQENKFCIRCFGKLEIVKVGAQRESMKLTNNKMKELLAYLIGRFGRPVSRRELLQLFFGRVEDKKTINYLHVTIYKIRQALENFGLDQSAAGLEENYTMKIKPGLCDYVDFVNFINQNRDINDINVSGAEKVLQTYRGLYLEEEDYPWAIDTREWVDKRFENLQLKIAAYYEAAGQLKRSEEILLQLLDRNPLAEEGWHALLNHCLACEKGDSFLHYYERYAKTLDRELKEKPPEKFARYYQKIFRGL